MQAHWSAAAEAPAGGALAVPQRQALLELFSATDGANWLKRHAWPAVAAAAPESDGSTTAIDSGTPCPGGQLQWFGVSCIAMTDTTLPGLHPATAVGGITALQLPANGTFNRSSREPSPVHYPPSGTVLSA